MEAWRLWQKLAHESYQAASAAEAEGCRRSAASRYYYGAFQAASALLIYRRLTPPTGMEAWGHTITPDLLRGETGTLIRSRDRRNDVALRLQYLYGLRIVADYIASQEVPASRVADARRDAGFILGVVDGLLP